MTSSALKPLTEIEKAYLAGLVDGEGCLNISVRQSEAGHSPFISCRLFVAGTYAPLADWLLNHVGGHVNWVVRSKPRVGWKSEFIWKVGGLAALELAELLLPYLVVKRQQALIFKAWVEVGKQRNWRRVDLHLGHMQMLGVIDMDEPRAFDLFTRFGQGFVGRPQLDIVHLAILIDGLERRGHGHSIVRLVALEADHLVRNRHGQEILEVAAAHPADEPTPSRILEIIFDGRPFEMFLEGVGNQRRNFCWRVHFS